MLLSLIIKMMSDGPVTLSSRERSLPVIRHIQEACCHQQESFSYKQCDDMGGLLKQACAHGTGFLILKVEIPLINSFPRLLKQVLGLRKCTDMYGGRGIMCVQCE